MMSKTVKNNENIKEILYKYFELDRLEEELGLPLLKAVFNRIIEHIVDKLVMLPTIQRMTEGGVFEKLESTGLLEKLASGDIDVEKLLKCVESQSTEDGEGERGS